MNQREARTSVRSLFPVGDEDLYAWDNPESWVARELEAVATAVRLKGADAIDQIRAEFRPHTSTEKLVDWERIFSVAKSSTAVYGSLAARRNQVVARWRENGASTPAHIRAAFAAVLGYEPVIVEQSRSALTQAHLYRPTTPIVIAANADSSAVVRVAENAPVSQAGVHVTIVLTHASVEDLDVRLDAPDGTTKTWAKPFGSGSVTGATFVLYGPEFAGATADGDWTLVVTNHQGHVGAMGTGTALFVEGIGQGDSGAEGLGANIFEWAVLVNPSLTGPDADFAAAHALVPRWSPAHSRGYFCRTASAVAGGGNAGVFDDFNAFFDECLFGS